MTNFRKLFGKTLFGIGISGGAASMITFPVNGLQFYYWTIISIIFIIVGSYLEETG